jgi:fumarate hydratase subunit beta
VSTATPRTVRLTAPLSEAAVRDLRIGDEVLLSGTIYTGRDAAHKRMIEALDRGETLPFPIEGAVIYYVGPTPAKPGQVIGSAGPTTSGRMDAYAPRLIALGLRAMIGKGQRLAPVVEACVTHGCAYLAATGGAGALLARTIQAAEVVAYDDLGPEAVRRLTVVDFPCIVALDTTGADLYVAGREQWRTDK